MVGEAAESNGEADAAASAAAIVGVSGRKGASATGSRELRPVAQVEGEAG